MPSTPCTMLSALSRHLHHSAFFLPNSALPFSNFQLPTFPFHLPPSHFPPGRRPRLPLRAGGRIHISVIYPLTPVTSLPSALCYLLPHSHFPMAPTGRRPTSHFDFLSPSLQLNISAQASPPPSMKIRSQIDSCSFASTWFWRESKPR